MRKAQSSLEYLYNFAFAMIIILGTIYALRQLGVVNLTNLLKERSQEVSSRIETLGVISKSIMPDGEFIIVIKNNSENALIIKKVKVWNDFSERESMYGNPTMNYLMEDDGCGFNETTLYPNDQLMLHGFFNPCGMHRGTYCGSPCGDVIGENYPYALDLEIGFSDIAGVNHTITKKGIVGKTEKKAEV